MNRKSLPAIQRYSVLNAGSPRLAQHVLHRKTAVQMRMIIDHWIILSVEPHDFAIKIVGDGLISVRRSRVVGQRPHQDVTKQRARSWIVALQRKRPAIEAPT